MASAGRILIMPKGNYDSSATYEMLDMVHYNGTSWLAKKTAKGIEPSATNSEYWHSMFDLDIANNLTTTDAGKALDARQGKVLNEKIENLKSTVMLLSTTNDYSDWTEVALSETYPLYKYVYIELKDSNDCLMDSVFIPSNMFANYNKGETVICLTSGDMRAYIVTQLASSVLINKSGGKLVIWGVERIS